MEKILVVDNQGVYRAGLRSIIEARFPHFRVLDTPSFSKVGADTVFDLILIDSGSLSYETLDLLAQAHEARPATRVAVMVTSKNRTDVLNYLSAGFHGVVHKLESDDELVTAIGDLLSGRIYIPSWIAHEEDLKGQAPVDVRQETLKLTPRQNEVLMLLARGMSNKEIARELNIAEGTSKIHTAALLRALGARNRTEAAFLAAKIVRSNDSVAHGSKDEPSRIKRPAKPLK